MHDRKAEKARGDHVCCQHLLDGGSLLSRNPVSSQILHFFQRHGKCQRPVVSEMPLKSSWHVDRNAIRGIYREPH